MKRLILTILALVLAAPAPGAEMGRGLGDVLPRGASYYFADCRVGYPIPPTECHLRFSVGIGETDVENIRVGQFRPRDLFTTPQSFGMKPCPTTVAAGKSLRVEPRTATVAARESLWVKPRTAAITLGSSSLLVAVVDVVGVRAKEKVVWPNARRRVAGVEYPESSRDGATEDSPRGPVGSGVPLAVPEDSVTVSILARGPHPALIGDLHLRHEPCEDAWASTGERGDRIRFSHVSLPQGSVVRSGWDGCTSRRAALHDISKEVA